MSFSGDVKEELARQSSSARHCQIAELAAIISLCGKIEGNLESGFILRLHTENECVARKYFTLLKKTFKINTEIVNGRGSSIIHKNNVYSILIEDGHEVLKVLQATKLITTTGVITKDLIMANHLVVQRHCCKRAFIRGAFLAAGSISDPAKFYHIELVCPTMIKAEQMQNLLLECNLDAKIVLRKRSYVVYLKEGAQIVEILGIMEANVSLMNLENVRILKEMRNSVNRKVNCETANIHKTVSAAVKQIEDIKYIRDTIGLEELSEGLAQIANLRLEYPELPLKELGLLLTPQVGKSGVNHRLRKLSNMAEELRGNKEEKSYD